MEAAVNFGARLLPGIDPFPRVAARISVNPLRANRFHDMV